MALRASLLGALTVWSAGRAGVKIEAVLLSYVFALLAMMLILDFRYFKAQ